MTEYTLEQCLKQQKKVDAGIKHNREYMPWLAGIKEVIEMCDHLSMIDTWKKQPEPDMKQAFMELVDVFAFAMSNHCEIRGSNPMQVDQNISNQSTVIHLIKRLLSSFTRSDTRLCITLIHKVCQKLFKRPITDIYYYYMGKQTLTRFRQDNGYKDGSYIKVWGEREDNEFLTDALEQGIEIDAVYEHLGANYERIVIAKAEVE